MAARQKLPSFCCVFAWNALKTAKAQKIFLCGGQSAEAHRLSLYVRQKVQGAPFFPPLPGREIWTFRPSKDDAEHNLEKPCGFPGADGKMDPMPCCTVPQRRAYQAFHRMGEDEDARRNTAGLFSLHFYERWLRRLLNPSIFLRNVWFVLNVWFPPPTMTTNIKLALYSTF